MSITLKRIYDDQTENLLDQYHAQLNFYEKHFDKLNGHLSREEYAQKRDADIVLAEIILIITQIYDQAIPIALEVTEHTGSFDSQERH